MKNYLWIGVLFLSISWLFFIPIFQPTNFLLGICFVFIGTIINIYSMWKNSFRKIDWRYGIVIIPLLISMILIEFPFIMGPALIFISILIPFIISFSIKFEKLGQISPGLFLSGIIMSFQACIYPIYNIIFSRYHNVGPLAQLVAWIGNLLRLNIDFNNNLLFINEIGKNIPVIVSWENLGVYIWINLIIGSIIIILLSNNKRKIISNLLLILLISFIYLIIRFIFSLMLLIELLESCKIFDSITLKNVLGINFNPIFLLISFTPLLLIFIKFFPLKRINIDVNQFKKFNINGKIIASFLMISLFTFSSVGAYSFQDPGVDKTGRILIDELHSEWEDTERELDTEWYGMLSTYNYYSWAEWLKNYYFVDVNINKTLDKNLLMNYDILILKCPTNAYSDYEINSIIQFVNNGGGLYLIGDHTNVFGMNSFLNQISVNFGISFKTDSVYCRDHYGGYYAYTTPKTLPHTIVQNMGKFQFLTSCSLDAPLTAENVILGMGLDSHPGTYAHRDFFNIKTDGRETRGSFLLCTAIKYGKGRVVAFSDSTTFSNYCVFMDGYKIFNLGTIEYLNKENKYDYINSLLFIISVSSIIITLLLIKNEKKLIVFLLFISILMMTFSFSALFFSNINSTTYRIPKPYNEFDKRVSFDMEHSGIYIKPTPPLESGEEFQRVVRKSFSTFFIWTQRIGSQPSLENDLENAINNSDIIVIINPNNSFSTNELSMLENYLINGGKVLLMDSVYNVNSTSNSILKNFKMQISTNLVKYESNIVKNNGNDFFQSEENFSIGVTIQPHLSVIGGKDILINNNQVTLSVKNVGKGLLAVFVDSLSFSDLVMGGAFVEPDKELRDIFEVEYYIFENLFSNIDEIYPGNISGYVYNDNNSNELFDIYEDQKLINVNVTFFKLDYFFSNKNYIKAIDKEIKYGNYLISGIVYTNNFGYYNISNLLPGFYFLSLSLNDLIIQEEYLYINSGENTYNISKAKSIELDGKVYYDFNNNGEVNNNETLDNANVDLYYTYPDGGRKFIERFKTDDNGMFLFSSLIPGKYFINVTKVNFTTGYLEYKNCKDIILYDLDSVTLNLSTKKNLACIEGYVKFNNTIINDVRINLLKNESVENNTAFDTQVKINKSGYYKIYVIPGYYNISIYEEFNEYGQNVIYFFNSIAHIKRENDTKLFNINLEKYYN